MKVSHESIKNYDFYFDENDKIVTKLDLLLCNTNLSDNNKLELLDIIEEIYHAGIDNTKNEDKDSQSMGSY